MGDEGVKLAELRDGLAQVHAAARRGQPVPIVSQSGREIARLIPSAHFAEGVENLPKIDGEKFRKNRSRVLYGCSWGARFLITQRDAEFVAVPPEDFPAPPIDVLLSGLSAIAADPGLKRREALEPLALREKSASDSRELLDRLASETQRRIEAEARLAQAVEAFSRLDARLRQIEEAIQPKRRSKSTAGNVAAKIPSAAVRSRKRR